MPISNIAIAVMGFVIGTLSNRIKLFGSLTFNFILAVLLLSLHFGLIAIGFAGFPLWLVIIIRWYFVGTFIWKVLALLPIPFLQPLAKMLS